MRFAAKVWSSVAAIVSRLCVVISFARRRRRYPRVKSTLSGRLLDFAESLPEVKRGPLHHLQQVRHYQRRHAEGDDATPPDGASIKLGSIRLIEGYSVEQFSGLIRSIEKLFPNTDEFGERDRAAEIDNAIRSLAAARGSTLDGSSVSDAAIFSRTGRIENCRTCRGRFAPLTSTSST